MIDFNSLGNEYETPLYVYAGEEIEKRIGIIKNVFKDFDYKIFYAMKANANPELLKILSKNKIGADIVGPGEFIAARRGKIEDILWNGNGKTTKDQKFFMENGLKYVVIDSFEEISMWENTDIIKLLRVNPDVDAKTHPHISTGLKIHKFGVPLDKIEKVKDKIHGLHLHIGSQITDVNPYIEAFNKAIDVILRNNYNFLDIGGGWGIDYDGPGLNIEEYQSKVIPVLKRFKGKLLLEPGRFIIGPSGYLLLKVVQVKKTPEKYFIVSDGGMNVLIRPSLYSAHHEIEVISPVSDEEYKCDFVGPLCETGDILGKNRISKIPEIGSYILIKNSGAYGYSMANNYNGMPKPAEVLSYEGKIKIIRKREKLEDLLKGCN